MPYRLCGVKWRSDKLWREEDCVLSPYVVCWFLSGKKWREIIHRSLIHITNMKYRIAYLFVSFLMTLENLEGHSPNAGLIKCNSTEHLSDIQHSFNWHGASRGPSAIAELLVFTSTKRHLKRYALQTNMTWLIVARSSRSGTFWWGIYFYCAATMLTMPLVERCVKLDNSVGLWQMITATAMADLPRRRRCLAYTALVMQNRQKRCSC